MFHLYTGSDTFSLVSMSVNDYLILNNTNTSVLEEYIKYKDNMQIPPIYFTINIQGDLVLYGILLAGYLIAVVCLLVMITSYLIITKRAHASSDTSPT